MNYLAQVWRGEGRSRGKGWEARARASLALCPRQSCKSRGGALLVFFVLFTLVLAAAPGWPAGESFTATLGEEVDPDNPATRAPDGEGDTKLTAHGDFDQPDLFTGTASYLYELKLPPGTNGMAPKLALVYRSTNDNGWFGMGWELEGLGCIEYSYKFGVPRYDGTDKDFVLKMGGATYELVPDDSNQDGGPGYYHTECETWMKIYFDGTTWTATGRNGTRWRFGGTPDSRVPIVDHNFIRLWALDRVEDVHGNYMTYSYVLDAPNGEYYPDKIVYTQNNNTTLRKLKTVSFIREPRTDNVRPHARWMTHRIKEIRVDIDGTLIEKWVLNYRYSNCSFRSLLASVSRYGNGDTPETTNFTYAADSGSLTWSLASSQYPTSKRTSERLYDFNGDGLMDNAIVSDQLFYTYDSQGRYISINGVICDRIYVRDLNCDGKDDLMGVCSTGADPIQDVYINNYPNGWIRNMAWEPPALSLNRLGCDLNNDAIPDYVYENINCISSLLYSGWKINRNYLIIDKQVTVYNLSDVNGDSWADLCLQGAIRLNNRMGSWIEDYVWVSPSLNDFSILIDVNCDGLADYYYPSSLYLNNSHGWSYANWPCVDQYQPLHLYLSDVNNCYDINNDGLLDSIMDQIVIRYPNGSVKYLNKPSSGVNPYYLNDDPFIDFLWIWVNGDTTYFDKYLSNAKPDLLTQVKLPTGGSVGYEYKRMPVVSYMSKDENGNPLPSLVRRGGVWRQYVVSKITTDEGTGRTERPSIISTTVSTIARRGPSSASGGSRGPCRTGITPSPTLARSPRPQGEWRRSRPTPPPESSCGRRLRPGRLGPLRARRATPWSWRLRRRSFTGRTPAGGRPLMSTTATETSSAKNAWGR